MRIASNIVGLDTLNKLKINNKAKEKGVEKLSSGLKINRAGDDAAGLAISEKMRDRSEDWSRPQEMFKMVFH